MKALTIIEYEPRPGCNDLHINPLDIRGVIVTVIVNVVLALVWATTVIAPAGGHNLKI
jgi:hypothetical protein